jgi:hypothetical protein
MPSVAASRKRLSRFAALARVITHAAFLRDALNSLATTSRIGFRRARKAPHLAVHASFWPTGRTRCAPSTPTFENQRASVMPPPRR